LLSQKGATALTFVAKAMLGFPNLGSQEKANSF
jgi:hypothetical protein